MRCGIVLVCCLAAAAASGVWLGDEYWTLIGARGQPIQGDPANFARLGHYFQQDKPTKFVAFWMTNTHYAGRMYEQFGEAYIKTDTDKYCASFTGEKGEAVEVCENFRILTIPERFKGRTIFEWVLTDSTDSKETDKIGYNEHRICAFAYNPKKNGKETKYEDYSFGDAVPSQSVANAVRSLGEYQSFDNYLLRLLVEENHSQQTIPRLPSPPSSNDAQHISHRHHQGRHQAHETHGHGHQVSNEQRARDQQHSQDAEYQRQLAEYNERVRLQQLQQRLDAEQREEEEIAARKKHDWMRQNEARTREASDDLQIEPADHHAARDQPQSHNHRVPDGSYVCDPYGRVFQIKKEADGRVHYAPFDLAAHGGVRPPCVMIGDSASGSSGTGSGVSGTRTSGSSGTGTGVYGTSGSGNIVQPAPAVHNEYTPNRFEAPAPRRSGCSGSRQKRSTEC